jgi:Zinc carboxypeptidase
MKNIIIIILGAIIVGGGVYLYINQGNSAGKNADYTSNQSASTTPPIAINKSMGAATTSSISTYSKNFVIGTSTKGKVINAISYGTGTKEIILVAGIHGDYSSNTANLVEELSANLNKSTNTANNIKITIIPRLNIEGHDLVPSLDEYNKTDGNVSLNNLRINSRFNANKVDLNRNFDCEWKAKGKFQTYDVSGGSAAFSEPESKALRDYILKAQPVAVIAYFSAAGGVYPSSCNKKTNTDSLTLTSLYSKASGYKEYKTFDAYETSGDMTNWLASINIPAISVLLTNHKDTELEKNIKGLQAVINHYNK